MGSYNQNQEVAMKPLGLACFFLAAWDLPAAVGDQPSEPATVVSRAEEGQELALTVYNVGRALVRDTRQVNLPAGTLRLEFRDIAAKVIPETVALAAPDLEVLEQNYEYDLLSPKTLLAKFLGKEVILVREEPRPEGPGTLRQEVRATLLAINEGTVWRIGDRIVSNPPYRELIFPQVPPTLREKPTLVWLVQVKKGGTRPLRATYLTSGLSWRAAYVLSLDKDGKQGRLTGWVTLENESGASYPNARLQLVAGEVNVEEERSRHVVYEMKATKAEAMEREALGEYHLYTLPRPTTLQDRQEKQVLLLEAFAVAVRESLRVSSMPHYFWSRLAQVQREPVQVQLEFANKQDNGLGVPLPEGVVRVYQRDSRGNEQFMGEDSIEHTPKDETVRLEVGEAFDVVAERVQTEFRSFDKTNESAFEVRLRNHKDEAVTVEVEEHLGGDWEMLAHSHPYTKQSAFVVVFAVPVPAQGQATLSYRVRVRH
jgi:hypothetical protein